MMAEEHARGDYSGECAGGIRLGAYGLVPSSWGLMAQAQAAFRVRSGATEIALDHELAGEIIAAAERGWRLKSRLGACGLGVRLRGRTQLTLAVHRYQPITPRTRGRASTALGKGL